MSAPRIFDARPNQLGEGPLWHLGDLYWFDITEGLLRSNGASGPREWRLGQMASVAAPVDDATFLIATETGLRRFDIASGEHEEIAPLEAGNSVTRSNDGRSDPMGGLWIGTMGKNAEEGAGSLYRFFNGAVEKLRGGITVPNSACFAPDGRRAYFTDTVTQKVMTATLDAEGWPEGAWEVFLDLRGANRFPDGAVTDAEGALWIACWGSFEIARYTAEGVFDRSVRLPARHVSCPAFGGPDHATLFVTSALQDVRDPDTAQGLIYAVEGAGRGRAEPRVRL